MGQGYTCSFEQLTDTIKDTAKRPLAIAIDGFGTSGKTTLARELHTIFSCAIVHMDDYFMPFEKRSPRRMNTPMGNIEWERLETEILQKLGSDTVYSPRYDCSAGAYTPPLVYDLSGMVIIEGVSSLRTGLRSYYDLSVFLSISPRERLRRVELRDPEWKRQRWIQEWIPLEDTYFAEESPWTAADCIIDGGR